ncbi:NAD(P)/FAD-dependent oxidoreductase [Actinoplanes sp. N902-109]|uniref:NAD(P)/FAD-dependent oxidoreductase n=1 Tax=Actinoplanes sp. (strain N902-109) TaxID=649831 RepID=UPI0003295AFB|nr:FAD-dependent monooxygenase [Actinoplanes sp. N902-109]AGL17728.1 hypothetical protein L083_4218 [Actinoplanes sp. N902-109]
MRTALVLGGGFAGVLAARALARHATVVLVEAGRYPAGPLPRPGLPQAHHNHVLVTGGARALDEVVPGTIDELLAAGAHRRDLTGDALILSREGWFGRLATDNFVISVSRWLLDGVVRRRALSAPGITVREQTRVLGLTGDATRVTGAVVAGPDGQPVPLVADLVVDATGRRSRAPRWLAALGGAPVEEQTAGCGLAYSTRLYQAPPGLTREMPAIMLHPRPRPDGSEGHGATLFPIEDGRWIVTLTGTRGNEPPVTGAGFAACLAELGSPILADLLAAACPIDGVRPYRIAADRRRFYERRAPTEGLLVLGDALTATNPVHSHGMSVAALSVLRLARELPAHSRAEELQAAVAAEAEPAWRMATGGGAGGRASRMLPVRALLGNPALINAFFRIQTLNSAAPAPLPAAGPPPAGTREAVAQFPHLSRWLRTRT